ncbi:hypothetical protein CCMA1212_001211, partial [Trichoderma ghanense]
RKNVLAAHARGFVETATENLARLRRPIKAFPSPASGPLRYSADSSTQAVYLQ